MPLDWTSINLTAGENPGILIIYTQDAKGTLLLITTVHTCGCYLAFLPTMAMPHDAVPADWSSERQSVYGYSLPSRLDLSTAETGDQAVFTLESETHRISDVNIADNSTRQSHPQKVPMTVQPMLHLYALPYRNETLSFFEMAGARRGYVKNNTKILEKLLISWWASM